MASINKLAVLVAAIVHFFLGMFWYDPHLFGNRWLAAIGKTPEQAQQTPMLMPIIASFIYYLLMAYVLAWVIVRTGAQNAKRGMAVAFVMWFAFVVTTSSIQYGFEGRPAVLYCINLGYTLVGMLLMGAIVGGWKRKAAARVTRSEVRSTI